MSNRNILSKYNYSNWPKPGQDQENDKPEIQEPSLFMEDAQDYNDPEQDDGVRKLHQRTGSFLTVEEHKKTKTLERSKHPWRAYGKPISKLRS